MNTAPPSRQESPGPWAGPTGWFGKLPSRGDFISRRLPPEFIEAWDAWLSSGIARWRRADSNWQDRYMQVPSLRFVLGPHVMAASVAAAFAGGRAQNGDATAALPSLAGIVMPSLDRVGRLFPFTLVRPTTAWPLQEDGATARILAWLQHADDLALQAVQEDWDDDRLDAVVRDLDLAAPAPQDEHDLQAGQWAEPSRHGWRVSLWCQAGEIVPHGYSGLPGGNDFLNLFGVSPVGDT